MEIIINETIIKESPSYPKRINASRIIHILSCIGKFVVVTRVRYNHTKSRYTVMDHMIVDRKMSNTINDDDMHIIQDCEDHPHVEAIKSSAAWKNHMKLAETTYENYHHEYYRYINGATFNKRYFTGIWASDRDRFIYMYESQNAIVTII